MKLTSQQVSEWNLAVRDVLMVLVGVLMLLHETWRTADLPSALIIGAALVLLGFPIGARILTSKTKNSVSPDSEA